MLAGAQTGAFVPLEHTDGGWILLGLASGAAQLAASPRAWRELVLLGFGTAGVFMFLPQAVQEYFGAALRGPLALFVAGVVLLTVALVCARLRDRMRQ